MLIIDKNFSITKHAIKPTFVPLVKDTSGRNSVLIFDNFRRKRIIKMKKTFDGH